MTDEPTDRMAAARAALAAKRAESAPTPEPEIPAGHVRVRVMKRGHERISTGECCEKETVRFPFWRQGDETSVPRDTADKYEDLGWVEIL